MRRFLRHYENFFIAIAAAIALVVLHAQTTHAIFVSAPQDPILTGDITSDMILDNTIVGADVSATAAISVGSIAQTGSSSMPHSVAGRLATSTSGIDFDIFNRRFSIGSTSPQQGASTTQFTIPGGSVIAANLTATGTVTLRGVTYTPPSADGTASQLLSTDGAGALSWTTVSTGFSMTAGQAMNANDPVVVEPSTNAAANEGSATGIGTIQCGRNDVERTAQSFKPSVGKLITKADISISKTGTPTGDVVFAIVADNNGTPATNATVASSTVLQTDVTGSLTTRTLTFSPAVYVPAGTRMWLLCYTSNNVNNISNYYDWGQNTANDYANGNTAYWQSGAWNIQAGNDQNFLLYDAGTTANNVYLASAIASSSASSTIGLTNSSVATSGSVTINGIGSVIASFRTLAVNKNVYLGDDPRSASTTPGFYSKVLGYMIAPTRMLVHINPF